MIILEIKTSTAHFNSKSEEKARFSRLIYNGEWGKDHSNFQGNAVTEKTYLLRPGYIVQKMGCRTCQVKSYRVGRDSKTWFL